MYTRRENIETQGRRIENEEKKNRVDNGKRKSAQEESGKVIKEMEKMEEEEK